MISSTLQEVARRAHACGFSVLPAATDGSKRPAIPWRAYQGRPPTDEELDGFLAMDVDGIGLVCGVGGLTMLEGEGRAVEAGLLGRLRERARERGLEELLNRISGGYLDISPSGGRHWLFRCTEVEGNRVLARNAAGDVLFETRGAGGWTVIAPSGGRTHPSGGSWHQKNGDVESVAPITPDECRQWLELFRSFDETPPHPACEMRERPLPATRTTSVAERPGDVFNRTHSWPELLTDAGFMWHHDEGDEGFWTRPGKDPRDGASVTTNFKGADTLKVFSSNCQPLEVETTYTKFGFFAAWHHGGDHSAAARALVPERPAMPGSDLPGDVSREPARVDGTPQEVDDLADCLVPWADELHEYEPDLVSGWLQAGTVSLFIGDGDTGKTMCVVGMFCSIATGTLWLGTPVSCTAGPVIYWGAEDPYAIPDRIKAWGVHNGIDVPRDRLLVVRRPAGRKLTLADLSWLDALTRGAVRLGASALAVDTVSVAGGLEEENANAEVGELMARCHTLAHETGMHITVLAHTPSTGALRPRGATAFYDNARQVLGIVADGKGRRISMTKNNNGPKPRPKSVRIEGVPGIRQIKGEEPQSVGVMVIDASEEAGRAEDDEIVLEVLRSLGGEVCHVPVLKLHAAIPPELEWSRAKVYTWCKRMVPRGRLEWVKKRGLRLQATNLVGDLLD